MTVFIHHHLYSK